MFQAEKLIFIVLFIAVSYLFGGILFSYWLGKIFRGIDIRKYGSKNPGARNAFRTLGPKFGVIACLLDITKGFLPVIFAYSLGFDFWIVYLSGFAALLGHIFPVFHRFKGGFGVSVSTGFLIGLIALNYFSHIPYSLFVGTLLGTFSVVVMISADMENIRKGIK